MQNLTQPTLLVKPFCQDGDRNQIPVQNDSLVDPQLADLTNGFPEITSKPPSQGGLPPERRDFNALGYLTTSYDWFYQAGGTFTFNQTISDSIGGYPLNARLWYTNSSGVSCILRSTIADNTNNFLLDDSVIGETGSGKPWEVENFKGISIKGFKLFYNFWSDYQLNDQSWLRADTFSWQNGTVYTEAYNHLVADYNGGTSTTETVGSYTITYVLATDGHKITTDETTALNIYNESGVAWYYILDTTNERFKLPRENPAREELIQVIRAKGNGMTLGGIDGNGNNFGLTGGDSGHAIKTRSAAYGVNVGSGGGSSTSTASGGVGLTTDSTKSGIISDMTDSTSVYKGKKYLYFYVGQYSQSATEQTAGLNSELFNGKADRDLNNVSAGIDFVVESYQNGTEWYRLYKSGWIEQGGLKTASGTAGSATISLLKEMASTNYNIQITTQQESAVGSGGGSVKRATLSVSSFDYGWASMGLTGIYWEVKGMSRG